MRLHVDHIHPQSRGGTNDLDNLVTACSDCNIGKGARLLGPVPADLAVAPGVWLKKPTRRRPVPRPPDEVWHIGSHCVTPMKVAALGTHMGMASYQVAHAYLDRLGRPIGMVQLPPLRNRDASWYTLIHEDPDVAFTLHRALIQALELPNRSKAA